MKTPSLLRSSLLAAGLLLGAAPAVHADATYSIIVHDGGFHRVAHDYRSCRHTPVWHSSHIRDRHHGHHGKHHSGRHGHGDWRGYGEHWLHGKYQDRHERGYRS